MNLTELPRKEVRAVFSDLDDTITDRSKILPATYAAIWKLKDRGYPVVIVSGRPAGWADCLMRLLPLDAMIFENGAGIITRDGEKLVVNNLAADANLDEQRAHLRRIFDRIKKKIPHVHLASDQPYRLFDFAIDYAEEPPLLSAEELRSVMDELAEEKQITAKLSSIHVNYWYGSHTKVTACEALLARFGEAWGIDRENVLYSGDSPNDEPLFEFFRLTVGVANIRKYLPQLKTPPRFLTAKPGGEGFREIVEHLIGDV